jgi:hypothetical protein
MAEPLEHDQHAVDAITAELVACTLGVRRRTELRVDLAALERMARKVEAFNTALGEALLPAFRRLAVAFATVAQTLTREEDQ